MIVKQIELDGYTYKIIIGKNAQENWDIIFTASSEDIWFHVDEYPSPHVILKIPENYKLKKVPKKILVQCALKCKIYSKYNNIKKLNIIYAKIKNVKKGDKIGSVTTTNTFTIII